MGREIESARIHNYIQGRARGRRLHILVPSYLSRYNPLVRSTPAGVRTPDATKISAKSDSTQAVSEWRPPLESDSGGLQSIGISPEGHGWEGNTLPRPGRKTFLIKAPPCNG